MGLAAADEKSFTKHVRGLITEFAAHAEAVIRWNWRRTFPRISRVRS